MLLLRSAPREMACFVRFGRTRSKSGELSPHSKELGVFGNRSWHSKDLGVFGN